MVIPLLLAALLGCDIAACLPKTPSLAERLGYKATDKLLIINGDDAGMCHTANLATIDCLEHGTMTSSTIMVPCPWFTEIARYAKSHPEKDFGLHLVQTSEWQNYRWGPVAPKSSVPGLIDTDGYFWHETPDVYKHATPEEVETEARAQIKMALAAGIDVTHLDSHMGVMQYDPRFFAGYVKLGKEFNLPIRMGDPEQFKAAGRVELREQTAASGLVFPDNFVYEPKKASESVKEYWLKALRSLKPGVTEMYIHAGLRTDELKAITNSWETRSTEHDLFTSDPDFKKALEDQNVIRIGYRALRDLQRQKK
jgi:predicted glycoside hydrolase/deacetylase ChbG (UPF0249 family)